MPVYRKFPTGTPGRRTIQQRHAGAVSGPIPSSLVLLLGLLSMLGMAPVLMADADATEGPAKENEDAAFGVLAEESVGVPLRIRNFTFPSYLVLGFAPTPAQPLGKGNWAFEYHFSQVNNFQVSTPVEEYLERTRDDGVRRRLGPTDVEAILALPEGDAFYIDGEFSFHDFTFYYGINDRLDIGLGWYYVGYSGGELDGTIFSFHDSLGFGQQGRDFVEDDLFQVVIGSDELPPLVLLDRPNAGGFSDPTLYLRYAFPRRSNGWQYALSAGIKFPTASSTSLLSTGNTDFGIQLTADRRWKRNALIVNVDYVMPGTFEVNEFDAPDLPAIHVSFLHQMKRWPSTRLTLQMLTAEHAFRDLIDSEFSELTQAEFQLTLGVKWDTDYGVFGLGLTENLFNMDNTPDIGVHFSWGYLGIGKKN